MVTNNAIDTNRFKASREEMEEENQGRSRTFESNNNSDDVTSIASKETDEAIHPSGGNDERRKPGIRFAGSELGARWVAEGRSGGSKTRSQPGH